MIRKFSALLAAFVLAATAFAPAAADARDRRGDGYHDRGYYRDYDDRRWRHRDRDYDDRRWRHRDRDRGDALAAGAVGLVLGLALGSMASQPRERDCYDNYRRCAPPPPMRRCHDHPCRYDDRAYRGDPRYYDDRGGPAYEREYGYEGAYDPYLDDRDRSSNRCVRQARVWDRRAGRYVYDEVPC